MLIVCVDFSFNCFSFSNYLWKMERWKKAYCWYIEL